MKVFRNDKCYVHYNDLTRYPVPDYFVFNKEIYKENEMVVLKDEYSIEYVRDRQDIIDYDDVVNLDDTELDLRIDETYKLLEPYAKRILKVSNEDRDNLYKNKMFMKDFRIRFYIYQGLSDYKKNRNEIDARIQKQINRKRRRK